MKKLCYILMVLCIIVIGTCVFVACNNEHPELKMFNYSVDGDEITIKNVKNKYKNTTEIIIPSGVTCIGERAFDGCNNLQSLTFSDTVSSFYYNAFYDCKDTLESLIVDEANTWIYSDNNCIIKKENKELILGCKSSVIPTDGSVVSIGNYAFAWSNIVEALIPDSIESLGARAFYACQSLSNVTIGDCVTNIEEEAFYNCRNLSSVTIGNGVTSIGKKAFDECINLNAVYITDLAKWCEIDFKTTNLLDYRANPLFYANNLYLNGKLITNLTIPNGVNKIGSFAFCYCSFSSVTIPNSVKLIGFGAFDGCENISNIDLGEGVETIGSRAFAQCVGLVDVIIPNSVRHIGTHQGSSIVYGAFDGCENLSNIDLGKGVETIGAESFLDCVKLKELTLPDSVTEIGDYAFWGTSLTEIVIPEGVNTIQKGTFAECYLLSKVKLPNTLKSIEAGGFYGCQKLREIIIPDSVEKIASNAFEDTEWYLRQPNGIVYAGKVVYCYKGSMPKDCTTIALKDDTKGIVEGAFSNCESLVNISIPDSVAYIGTGAFAGCVNLETIYIGSNSSLPSYDLAGGNWIENCSAEIVIIQSKQG